MISETMSFKAPALKEKWLLKRKKTKEEKQEAERKIFNTREEVKKSRKEIQNHHKNTRMQCMEKMVLKNFSELVVEAITKVMEQQLMEVDMEIIRSAQERQDLI